MGVDYYPCGYCGDPRSDHEESIPLMMASNLMDCVVHPDCYDVMIKEGYLIKRRVSPTIVGEDHDGRRIYFCPDLDVGAMKEKAVKCIGIHSGECTDPERGWCTDPRGWGDIKKTREGADTFEEAIKTALSEKNVDYYAYVYWYTAKYYEDEICKKKREIGSLEKRLSREKKRMRLA